MLESLPAFTLIFASRLLLFSLFSLYLSHSCFIFCHSRCFYFIFVVFFGLTFHVNIFILISIIIYLKIILHSPHLILSSGHSYYDCQEADICILQFI
jgi:hypothetical protein